MDKTQTLVQRLGDKRSKQVVFLSHCLLNQNTRYLGGACRGGCVQEVVEPCLKHDIGIVQMPCPEQLAWGGVLKRWLLMAFGAKGTLLYRLRGVLLPLVLWYTRLVYWRLARGIAIQIKDYLDSGFKVVGVMGVDGSPSCGVHTKLDLRKSLELIASMKVKTIQAQAMNDILYKGLSDGRGIFTELLQRELERRGVKLPYLAHDLVAELEQAYGRREAHPSVLEAHLNLMESGR